MLDSVVAMRSLRRSSAAGWSVCDVCDDGRDERNETSELAVACLANDVSESLEGEGRADGGRDGVPVLRPLRGLLRGRSCHSVYGTGVKRGAYLLLQVSKWTWIDEFASLAAASGLEPPELSRDPSFAMVFSLSQQG